MGFVTTTPSHPSRAVALELYMFHAFLKLAAIRWRRSPLLVALILGVSVPAPALWAQVTGRAVVDEPFGVATVNVPLPAGSGEHLRTQAIWITERDGRVFYPAISSANRGIASRLGGSDPREVAIAFLFRGTDPLELTIHTPSPIPLRLTPSPAPAAQSQSLWRGWWTAYEGTTRTAWDSQSISLLPRVYLTTMLADRLQLRRSPFVSTKSPRSDKALESLAVFFGGQSSQREIMARWLGQRISETDMVPRALPAPPQWQPLVFPEGIESSVEPIALHVPEECFYIRFGSFSNYLWFQKFSAETNDVLGSLINPQGAYVDVGKRIERQLGLETSALAELLGDQLVADAALVGRDLFLQEGAAFGILLQARNTTLLGSDLQRQRRASLQREQARGAVMKNIELAGQQVSLLSTPDNRLRSFYVVQGDFHLVTTSRTVATRFVQAADQGHSIGHSAAFRQARRELPLERNDSLFLFLSPAYFQTLAAPESLVELQRRRLAGLELDLLSLARQAAQHEGLPGDSMEDLQRAGLLPLPFGVRLDGSEPQIVNGELRDSLRGSRGTFLPIADVEVDTVTAQESDDYLQVVRGLSTRGGPVDPLVVAIQRTPRDSDGRERLSIEARLAPFQESRYDRLFSILGPPVGERVVLPPDSVISVQAAVQGGRFAGLIPPHQLFLGVYDLPTATPVRPKGLLGYLEYLRATPGFLGTWPKAGFLDLLPLALAPPPDPAGYSHLPLGLWRWQQDGFSVLSFDQGLLRHATPQLQTELTDNPAQIRVQVADLGSSNLATMIHSAAYDRAAEGTTAHIELMNTLTQQFGTPPDKARVVAEQFLRGTLRCPTGGEYALTEVGADTQIWRSTTWSASQGREPGHDYETKVLDWCRGLDVDVIKEPEHLQLHAELQVKRQPPPATDRAAGLWDLLRGGAPAAGAPPPKAEELPAPRNRREF